MYDYHIMPLHLGSQTQTRVVLQRGKVLRGKMLDNTLEKIWVLTCADNTFSVGLFDQESNYANCIVVINGPLPLHLPTFSRNISTAETFLRHQDTIFGRLACRLRYRDQGLIFKNDLPRQLQRLSWWNHPLLSVPMQTTDFWTYWRSRVTCDAVDPLEETKKSSPQNVSHLICPWGPHHLLHPSVRRSSAFPTSTHGYNGLMEEKDESSWFG